MSEGDIIKLEKAEILKDDEDEGGAIVRVVYWFQKFPTRGMLRHISFYACNPVAAEHLVALLSKIDDTN